VTTRWTCLAAALAAAALVAGCGGDEGGGEVADMPPPAAKPEDFPRADGRSLTRLLRQYGAGGPVLVPAVGELDAGRNRFGFGLFDRERAQIADAPVALYVAPAGGGPARGPFPARYESLDVPPQFQSRTVASDPDAARTVYVANLEFDRPGRYEVLALARLDDRLVAASPASGPVEVAEDGSVPDVGDRAPRIHTPTKEDVGGDLEQIDTRIPPSTMHDVDFADVVGKDPIVLIFATPQLCRSRVCGPVVDIAEQVKAERGGDARFIHMEIYRDNVLENGFRPQFVKWRLPSEPWVFTVDRRGRIAARMEGAFSARELDRAIDAATKG
jgi:hypothetical protein